MSLSRLLRNIFSNYALMAVAGLIGFLLTPILFHRLQPTGYAILIFSSATVAVVQAFDLGLYTTLIRSVSDLAARGKEAELRALSSSVFYLMGAWGALGAVTITALSSFLTSYFGIEGPVDAPAYLVVSLIGLGLVFQMPSTALRGLLIGYQDFHWINAVGIVVQLIRAASTVGLLYAGFGLVAIAGLVPAVALLELTGLLAIAGKARIPFHPRLAEVRWASLRQIWGFASLSFVKDTLTRWFFQLDSFLVVKLLPLPNLAILAVARRFPQALTDLSIQTLAVAYPMVSSAAARNDQTALHRFLVVATRNLLALTLPVAAALYFWATVILRLWIGGEVLTGVPVFQAFLFFAVFAAFKDVPLSLLSGAGNIRFSAALSGVLLVAAIGAGAWACTHYGLIGLAVSYAAIQMAGTVLLYVYSLRLAQIPFRHWLRKAVIPNLWPALATILWFWISSHTVAHNLVGLTISTAIGFVLYFTLFTGLVGGLQKQPWKTLARRLLTEID